MPPHRGGIVFVWVLIRQQPPFGSDVLRVAVVLFSCCLFLVGGVLLSHTLPCAVPSALMGLASGFGMGPGVSRIAITTDTISRINSVVLVCVGCDTA